MNGYRFESPWVSSGLIAASSDSLFTDDVVVSHPVRISAKK